jgi:lysophospholipase L1-like esterase
MRMSAALLTALLPILLAVAGIAAHAASESGARPKQNDNGAKVIAFYGDSTIRGYKTHSGAQVAISTPQAFAESLAPAWRVVVRNEGADSSRVEHLLAGTDGRHAAWHAYLPSSGVNIVIINHASKNGNPVAQYKADMRRVVRLARENGKAVILMTPNPISEGGLEPYVEAMRQLALEEKVPLIDVFAYLKDYMARTGASISELVPDGYHPADEVYVLIGKYAAREFQNMARPTSVRGKSFSG